MHHAEKHVAGLVVLRLDIILYRFGKRHIASLVALDNLAALLIYDNNMVVFVNDLHDQ